MASQGDSSQATQHTDPSGLSMKKLERGVWFLEHRKHFKRVFIAILILISVLSWGYNIYYVTKYLAVGMEQDARTMQGLSRRLLPNHAYFEKLAPDPIQISGVRTVENAQDIDIMVELQNPNPKHYAYFSYCFDQGKKNIKCDQSFLLPGQKKYVFDLAESELDSRFNVNFRIKGTNWDKLNAHNIPDWTKHKQERLNVDFQEVEFVPAQSSGVSEEVDLARLKFTAFNDSSYNYYEMPLKIILYKGNKVVGINEYTLTDFSTQEKIQVEMTWPNISFNVSDIEIKPDVNILNTDNFRKPGS